MGGILASSFRRTSRQYNSVISQLQAAVVEAHIIRRSFRRSSLIYLDPPFNSNATYNVLFAEKSGRKSTAQITAFEDTWEWGEEPELAYWDVVNRGGRLADLLQSMRVFLGQNDMMAYLCMMAVRLQELHRVLKENGSLYLH